MDKVTFDYYFPYVINRLINFKFKCFYKTFQINPKIRRNELKFKILDPRIIDVRSINVKQGKTTNKTTLTVGQYFN